MVPSLFWGGYSNLKGPISNLLLFHVGIMRIWRRNVVQMSHKPYQISTAQWIQMRVLFGGALQSV